MQSKLLQAIEQLKTVIFDKEEQLKLSICCLLSRSHLLIEDLPGMGKTTFAHAFSQTFGLPLSRIQFTSDLLPADITGTTIVINQDQQTKFKVVRGPIFTSMLLADEINRATPKTQSALLEGMEEKQVTIDGKTLPLKEPFFVLATQNPFDQVGTYHLPESQLDRFALKISLGYPSEKAEMLLLKGGSTRTKIAQLPALFTPDEILTLQTNVNEVNIKDNVLAYAYRLIKFTRVYQGFKYGLSTRSGLLLIACAKSYAYIAGRDYVMPDDIKAVFPALVDHRLISNQSDQNAAQWVLSQVEVL